jgi:DNA-cytosine methyltransferase
MIISSSVSFVLNVEDSSSLASTISLLNVSKSLSKQIGQHINRRAKIEFEKIKSKSNEQNNNNNNKLLLLQEFLFSSFMSSPMCANQSHFTYIELFAGVGGFGMACEKLGGRCVFASEIVLNAQKCWQRNFGIGDLKFQNETKQKIFGAQWNKLDCVKFAEQQKLDVHNALKGGDIRQVSDQVILDSCFRSASSSVDLLCAGFPCQPFSRAGNQPATQVEDGNLYLQIIRILKLTKPKVILLENVPGLHTAEEGEALKKIGESLSEVGYDVMTGVIDSSCLVPQIRRRMYFVGFLRDENDDDDDEKTTSEPMKKRRRRNRDESTSTSTSSSSSSSSFSWPKMFRLQRTFSEILQDSREGSSSLSEIINKNFLLAESRWQKYLEICSDIPRWLVKMDRPGPTLLRSYRRGPGVGAGKKFFDAVLARDQKQQEEQEKDEKNKKIENSTKNNKNDDDEDDDQQQQVEEDQHENGNESSYRHNSGWHNLVPVSASSTNISTVPVRWISAREGARMQGFPESFWIPEENEGHGPGTALFGNAVTVPVIAAILHSALKAAKISTLKFASLNSMLKEILLDAVPAHSRAELENQIEQKFYNEEDVVMFSRILK